MRWNEQETKLHRGTEWGTNQLRADECQARDIIGNNAFAINVEQNHNVEPTKYTSVRFMLKFLSGSCV